MSFLYKLENRRISCRVRMGKEILISLVGQWIEVEKFLIFRGKVNASYSYGFILHLLLSKISSSR